MRRPTCVGVVAVLAVLLGTMVAAGAQTPSSGPLPPRTEQPSYDSFVTEEHYISSRYGHQLHIQVTFPAQDGVKAGGRFPVIAHLVYTGASISGMWEAFVKNGYVVAQAEVPGAGESEGVWEYSDPAWQLEVIDMINWLGTQRWSTGKIGTIGGSGNGMSQLYVAQHRPKYLKTMIPQVITSDPWEIAMRGGMRNVDIGLLQCTIPGALTNTMNGFGDPNAMANKALNNQYQNFTCPLVGPRAYRDTYDAYWKSVTSKLENVTIPVWCQTGWNDIFVDAMQVSCSRVSSKVKMFTEGYASHGSAGSTPGFDWTEQNLRWFDRWLKGIRNGIDEDAEQRGFQYFLREAMVWKAAPRFPIPDTRYTPYYIDGAAVTPHAQGGLSTNVPTASSTFSYAYNPASSPNDGVGGNFARLAQPNSEENNNLLAYNEPLAPKDQRLDPTGRVAFLSPPLTRPVEATGPVSMTLYASTTAADTDFVFKVVDVFPDDQVSDKGPQPGYWNYVTDGQLKGQFRSYKSGFQRKTRIPTDKVVKYEIKADPAGYYFKKGHRIGLIVQSANTPRYQPNANPALITVHSSPDHPSHLLLPIQSPDNPAVRTAAPAAQAGSPPATTMDGGTEIDDTAVVATARTGATVTGALATDAATRAVRPAASRRLDNASIAAWSDRARQPEAMAALALAAAIGGTAMCRRSVSRRRRRDSPLQA